MAAMMATGGESQSIKAQRKNVLKIFDTQFRNSSSEVQLLAPVEFGALLADQACNRLLFQAWAYFLTNVYKQASGAFLGCDSVLNYMGCLLQLVVTQFTPNATAETKLFFTCQTEGSEENRWMRGLKLNIRRTIFKRQQESGNRHLLPFCLRTARRLMLSVMHVRSKSRHEPGPDLP